MRTLLHCSQPVVVVAVSVVVVAAAVVVVVFVSVIAGDRGTTPPSPHQQTCSREKKVSTVHILCHAQ